MSLPVHMTPVNFCTRCGSTYTQPGTCNCYAPQNIRIFTTGGTYDPCALCQQPCGNTACPKATRVTA
jgi:hypothetical protein